MWHKVFSLIICVQLLLVFPVVVNAEKVILPLSGGSSAVAQFKQGDSHKPALIIIHPFLQTGNFSTIRQLADEMSDSGYTVLLPTLTLGVNARQEVLPCEALHTTTLNDSADEISAWVKWLEAGASDRQPVDSIVLIGHSTGTLSVVKYGRSSSPSVKKSILLSLMYFQDDGHHKTDQHQIDKAKQLVASGNMGLETFSMAYCRKYLATAEAFLSLYEMNREQVVKGVQQMVSPVSIIIGSEDVRIAKDWPQQIKRSGLNITVINGATHFFDQGHEFDLVELLESELEL